MKETLAYQQNELLVIEYFQDVRNRCHKTDLLVKWTGFAKEEIDWVSIEPLHEYISKLLLKYLCDCY